MFVRFLRLLFGSVRFSASNGFTDRFINLCWSMDIPLWDVQRTKDGLTASTGRRCYRRLRAAAKKTGVRLHAEKKNGFPFLIRRNRMRAGMLAGLAVGILFTAYVFSAVWQVDVNGCETLSASAVLAAAEEYGLTRGVPRRSVNPANIRRELVHRFPQINWCAVNLRGAKAEIIIREVKQGVGVFDGSGVYDIVAAKDGQIEQIDVFRGKSLVRNLDTVTRGQLLISGFYETRNGTPYSTHAAGSVIAMTTEYVRAAASSSDYQMLKNVTHLTAFYLFGAKIPPFGPAKRAFVKYNEKDLGGADYVLPIGIIKYTAFDLERTDVLDKKKTILLSMMQAYDTACDMLSKAELVDAHETIEDGEIRMVLHLRENIAVERPVDIPEKN